MEAKRGRPIILNMEETGYKLDGSHSVSVWGFNGNYLGPTIRIKSGSFAKLNYHNNLPQSIALSIQGLASGELLVVPQSLKERRILGSDYPDRATCRDLLVSLCHPGELGLSNLSRHRGNVVD